jgi:hypothetical protein
MIPQFGSRSFLLLVLFLFLFLSFVLGALHAYRAYRASIRSFWIVTAKKSEIDNPCYRVAYLFDRVERHPVIIAIEKTPYEEVPIALPSFCTANSPIRSGDRVAFLKDLKIDGCNIKPNANFQVFLAELGSKPSQYSLSMEQYRLLVGSKSLKDSAEALWCTLRHEPTLEEQHKVELNRWITIGSRVWNECYSEWIGPLLVAKSVPHSNSYFSFRSVSTFTGMRCYNVKKFIAVLRINLRLLDIFRKSKT